VGYRLWQINVRVRDGVIGAVPLFVIAQTLPSNAVSVVVR
jgi:hypothetical protein